MEASDDFYAQVHFSGESTCPKFKPNPFRYNFCTACLGEISKHKKSAVEDKETLMKALEYTQSKEKVGSLIIPYTQDTKTGGLYLDGYSSSINKEFISTQHITHILNTAAGLGNFLGPKYQKSVQSIVNDFSVEYLTLSWIDAATFVIPVDDIIKGLQFIDSGRRSGNVLVHCAQGKSRSSTIVVAYIMALLSLSHSKAVEFVKEKRKMAQPNPGFLELLSSLNKETDFINFQKQILK